ncbi:MAG: alpha/beta hydrolase [Oscillospiraceae bacterium]|nr:alpha/beta hydrolase [Oscillospiraceae bacterium]
MKTRRILAAALCVALLLSALALPASAMESTAQATPTSHDCALVPIVWIEGFGQALFRDQGTPNERVQRPVNIAGLFRGLPGLIGGAFTTAFSFRPFQIPRLNLDPLARGIAGLLQHMTGHLQLDIYGQCMASLTANWRIDPNQCHQTNRQFQFEHDYRMCPFVTASLLHDFIEALVEHTGHPRVALNTHSQGGVVAMAYLAVYGSDRVDTLVLSNSAFQGLRLVPPVLQGRFNLTPQAAANLMRTSRFTNGIANVLQWLRVFNLTAPMSTIFQDRLMPILLEEYFMPMFGRFPSVWAFIPADYFDEVASHFADDPQFEHILAGARRYQEEVLLRAEELLLDAMDNGTHVAIVASYGRASIEFDGATTSRQSDTLIETDLMSGGATVARFGQTLPGCVCVEVSRHRSPCGIIDASTAMLPDNTWFIKNNTHDHPVMRELHLWLIDSPVQPTVWDNEAFPQFLIAPGRNRPAIPLQ